MKKLILASFILCILTACNFQPTHYHSHKEAIAKEPTCISAGIKEFRCSCGHVYSEVIPATGHSYDKGVLTTAPTCSDEGILTYTCFNCGETKEEPVSKILHSYDDGVVTEPATCTTEGVLTHTCSGCGTTVDEEIPPTGHKYDEGVTTAEATCSQKGEITYTCAYCGDIRRDETDELGHDFDDGIICSRCGTSSITFAETGVVYCDSSKTDKLDVTLNYLNHTQANGYNTYSISYKLENNVEGSIIAPGIFKIIYKTASGTFDSSFQNGFFNDTYYGDVITRTYSWKLAAGEDFVCIEYIPYSLMTSYIFYEVPTDILLNWVVE